MGEVALSISGLGKPFGRKRVLRGLDMDLRCGSVTVLMGTNGAGKSTLVKIICGCYRADEGSMALRGKPYRPSDTADAIAQGVVTVHQSIDDGVFPDLDIANNLLLYRLVDAPLLVRSRAMRREARQVAAGMGLTIDMRTRVADLGVAQRQMIVIARAMARTPQLLILDEPTSSLSASEADLLFTLIDRLRDRGVALLLISHRMSDIRRIADCIVSIRDGTISGLFTERPLDYEGAVTAMLGRDMAEATVAPVKGGRPVLELDDITLIDTADKIGLTVAEGEVVAVTGLLGSGKTRLCEIIFGRSRSKTGGMWLDAVPYAPQNVREAVERGVYMLPRDRACNAVIPDFDIVNNMTLPFLGSFCGTASLLRGREQRIAAQRMIKRMGIVCRSGGDPIDVLRGGGGISRR